MKPTTLGRYRLETQLSGTESTQIWSGRLVTKEGPDRKVTLKIVAADDEGAVRRLRAEYAARLMIQDKRHVVECIELFEDKSSRRTCLVMEHFRGGTTLRRLIHARPVGGGEGALDVAEAVELFRQACLGLRAVHGAGLVHGDLRPENLLLKQIEGGEWHLCIGGLGSASNYRAPSDSADAISAPTSVGTPAYCAPEAWTNETNPKSDAYGLGFAFYELMTGRAAFDAQFAAQERGANDADRAGLWRRWHTDRTLRAAPVRDACAACPLEIARLIDGMIQKDVAARIEVSQALAALPHSGPLRLRRPPGAEDAGADEREPTVLLPGKGAARPPRDTHETAGREAPTMQTPAHVAVTHVAHSSLEGRVQTFEKDIVRLGRKPDNDVVFDVHLDRLVSAYHAVVTVEGGRAHVRDLDSKNGVWVNGRMIRGSAPLQPGDIVRLGQNGPEFRVTCGAAGRQQASAESSSGIGYAGDPPSSPSTHAGPFSADAVVRRGNILEVYDQVLHPGQPAAASVHRKKRSKGLIVALVIGCILLAIAAAKAFGSESESRDAAAPVEGSAKP